MTMLKPPEALRTSAPARGLRRAVSYLRRPRTTPARIRRLVALTLVGVVALFAATALVIQHSREGLRVIGQGAGPEVVTTTHLYYALNDMDDQVATILLIGAEEDLGNGRENAEQRYEQRRLEAGRALLRTWELTGSDQVAQRTVRELLEKLDRYDRLVAEALIVSEQADYPPGEPPEDLLDRYREATSLMQEEILPKAYNLTLASSAVVQLTYQEQRVWLIGCTVAAALAGIAAAALLLRLQFYLHSAFRRRINPALALATVVAVVLTAGAVNLGLTEIRHLRVAKEDGFDSILALSQARAISIGLHANQSRVLLDPERADYYERTYLRDSELLLDVPAVSLTSYYNKTAKAVGEYYPARLIERAPVRGLLWKEAESTTLDGQRAALGEVLRAYRDFQEADREMRALAEDDTQEAVAQRLGTGEDSVSSTYDRYDAALLSLIGVHNEAFQEAISSGEDSLAGWNVMLPVAAIAVAALVVLGARPRLAEYR